MVHKQRAPELLRTPRPQHPERNVGGDPPALLNVTASSCPTCHMSGEENQFCRVHRALRRERRSAKAFLDPASCATYVGHRSDRDRLTGVVQGETMIIGFIRALV